MTDVEAATEPYEVYKEMQKEATEDHLFIQEAFCLLETTSSTSFTHLDNFHTETLTSLQKPINVFVFINHSFIDYHVLWVFGFPNTLSHNMASLFARFLGM